MCGGGFCEGCASKSRIVPTWGSSPVRVCEKCFDNESPQPARSHCPKVGEALHTTLETVASAVSYPLGFIKDSARQPTGSLTISSPTATCVKSPFGPKVSKHHCRACGQGFAKTAPSPETSTFQGMGLPSTGLR
ncbi:hypothetical protein JTE90_002222 [Oedothorax gibbosus]|uniref:Uncharacterized protein n=1 Tax=Oedothorax gibbosus TaxID=931172 RepID=A0AAV6TPZ7_9ARAC|nr:hypothetical protein JTE90_002222 [Oedothorax gibbosus]